MSVNALNQTTIQLSQINCGECGGTYAINERYRAQKAQDGGTWNCPYCRCGWGYAHNNENAKLKAKVDELTRSRDFYLSNAANERKAREATERRLTAQRSATKRIKNRVKHGVCPCCTRSFDNLREHMKTKHPEYVAESA